jgi:hypothetical protein
MTRPSQAFVAAGKLTKPLWLIITGVAAVPRCAASPRTGAAPTRVPTAPGKPTW